MSDFNPPRVESGMNIEQLANIVARVIKEVAFVFDGNVDLKNVRARSLTADRLKAATITAIEIAAHTITADKMSVNQLSAISADLGSIIAGVVTGAWIRTAEGGQRVELSSTENLLKAVSAAGSTIKIKPSNVGSPYIEFEDTTNNSNGQLGYVFDTLTLYAGNGNKIKINAFSGDVEISAGGAVKMYGSGGLYYNDDLIHP